MTRVDRDAARRSRCAAVPPVHVPQRCHACAITVLLRWPVDSGALGRSAVLEDLGRPGRPLAVDVPGDLLDNPRGFRRVPRRVLLRRRDGEVRAPPPPRSRPLSFGSVDSAIDPLGWSVLAGVGIWAAGGVLHVESLGRVIPLASTACGGGPRRGRGRGTATRGCRPGQAPLTPRRDGRAYCRRAGLGRRRGCGQYDPVQRVEPHHEPSGNITPVF